MAAVIRVLDLFSGIGGFSLGLESTGRFQTIGFCEIEPFPREVLAHHWPGVPIWDDVRTLTAESLGGLRPDAIVGGFPCQDISVAGRGAGIDGARSGLWSEMFRLVRELRPRWVLAENVPALRTRGADRVLSDLEEEGYSRWPLVVGAWAVGAPHKRDRVWVVAHCGGDDLRQQPGRGSWARGAGEAFAGGNGASLSHEYRRGQPIKRSGRLLDGERETSRDDVDRRGERPVGSPTGSGLEGQRADAGGTEITQPWHSSPRWPARPGEPQHEWEEPRLAYGTLQPIRSTGQSRQEPDPGSPQLPLGQSAHGIPERLVPELAARSGMARPDVEAWLERNRFRVERKWNREALKALGNSVVPQVVAVIGQSILTVEEQWWQR